MKQDRDIEMARARLNAIKSTLEDLLCIAHEAEEYLLGAKLADSQMCVINRLSALAIDEQ